MRTKDYRTNVAVVNLGTETATVLVQLYGSSGSRLGSPRTVTASPGRLTQETDSFTASGAGDQPIAYATLDVETAGALIWAYATVTDNGTNDSTIVPLIVP